ncbi:hypothetical protein [Cellulomonas phragmiteti]|uniref:DUF3558 domain-containing protein n=1 Tax=Cellulomonas phragmiteti TaxID=478780 RepID=A0ABQ4DPI8_9CELL|nr:hypothetical protein [Cellulomonas phragmiteti]GIG40851.1 hypothetical protein Cph01nite_26130 [Cellulomonas phragmiteti]
MRRAETRYGRAGCLLAVAVGVLLTTGCTSGPDPAPVEPSATGAPAPSAPADPTFEQAVAALTDALVPTAEVRPCEEYEPGSPQEQEHLERLAAELAAERGAATDEEAAAAPSPTPPSCGIEGVEALRAASLTGFAHGPGADVVLPTPGGAARVVEVYELADAEAAAATYARHVADPEEWATDQEIPAAELEGGYYQPRRVVSGAAVSGLDVPDWAATVLSRDEAGFARDGSASSAPVSYGYLWAVRGPLVVRVQVAGDEPGAAAGSAETTLRAFVDALEQPTG